MIRFKKECADCLTRKYTQKYPADANPKAIEEYQNRVRAIVEAAPKEVPAPVVVRDINDMREELLGSRVVYSEIKSHFNQLMLTQEERVRRIIAGAADPLWAAIQYVITGNLIDLGAFASVDEEQLARALDQAEQLSVIKDAYPSLCKDLSEAKELVYLTDNCGEIVMDKLLIELLKRQYPKLHITVIVKGAEVLNDATMEDALEVGLTDVVDVIDNGNNIAGSWLLEFPPKVLSVMDRADLILSKGQANFETLRCCGRNIYYLFLCKCELFSGIFQVPLMTAMLTTDKKATELEQQRA